MCVDLIVGSGDIEAISVPAEVLVSVLLHSACTLMYRIVLGKRSQCSRWGGGCDERLSLLRNAVALISKVIPDPFECAGRIPGLELGR